MTKLVLGTLALGATVLVVLLGISVQPVRFRFVVKDENGNLQDADETTPGARVLLGTSSHILPLVRFINFVGHPFRKSLVPLKASDLKKEAVEMFGHDDFGDFADWEAFDRWVEVADERCHLVGRVFMKNILNGALAANLKVQHLLKKHPEIHEEVVEKPIFVAAFSRTGGTFLYQVLADTFDQELMPAYTYETLGGPLELRAKQEELASAALFILGVLNPPMKVMHEWISTDDPDEEAGWFQFTVRGVAVPFTLPSQWHHLRTMEESTSAINARFWETLKKIKQWQTGKKLRFISKSPDFLLTLPELHKNHPDATFVTVYRDEAPWYPTQLVIAHLYRQLFVTEPTVDETIQFTDYLNCQQRRALQVALNGTYDKSVIPVKFGSRLFTNTFEIVADVAEKTGLPWDASKQQHAKDVIAKRLGWKKVNSTYKIEDFGLSTTLIAERIKTICETIPQQTHWTHPRTAKF